MGTNAWEYYNGRAALRLARTFGWDRLEVNFHEDSRLTQRSLFKLGQRDLNTSLNPSPLAEPVLDLPLLLSQSYFDRLSLTTVEILVL